MGVTKLWTLAPRWAPRAQILCGFGVLLGLAPTALARVVTADKARPEPQEAHRAVTTPLGANNGEIDWTARIIRAKSVSPGAIGAYVPPNVMPYGQRRAESLAQQALALLVRAIVIGGPTSGGGGATRVADVLNARGELVPILDASIKKMQVTLSSYGGDGSVSLEVALPLDGEHPGLGALWAALAPSLPESARKAALQAPAPADASAPTGIVINARGTPFIPSLWPRIIDGSGTVLYGPEHVPLDVLVMRGLMGAAKSLETALHDERVAQVPVVFNAKAIAPDDPYTLVLGDHDARAFANLPGPIEEARVVVVVD